jgi:AhpD family alkylhydroperoxidase
MTLTTREKELVAVGISVAAGCRPCTDYHLKAVRKAGASEAEVCDAIESAASIRRNAADSIERYALRTSADVSRKAARGGGFDRVSALLAIGAAYAVSCTESLEERLGVARDGGIGEDELREVLELAVFIKRMADRHVRKLASRDEAE